MPGVEDLVGDVGAGVAKIAKYGQELFKSNVVSTILKVGAAAIVAKEGLDDLGKIWENKTTAAGITSQVKLYQDMSKELAQLGRGEHTDAFIKKISGQAHELAMLGISFSKLKEANLSLLTSYDASIIITDKQGKSFENNRNALAKLITFNEKFGVSQGDSTRFVNEFNNQMERGPVAAQKFSDALIIFSQETGQKASKVFQEFNENIDRFSILGSQKAIGQFEKLQAVAARTGTSVRQIISGVEAFDDIDKGFEKGGQINRVLSFLGGSFDTFKAMQATDDEREQMLLESIQGVAGKFAEQKTDQAKRSMAKQIQETTGVDMKTVVGLLNKTTDLSKDLQDISSKEFGEKTRPKEFTESGREAAAQRLTTNDELKEVRNELMNFGPAVVAFSKETHAMSLGLTSAAVNLSTTLNNTFETTSKNGGFAKAWEDLKLSLKDLPKALSDSKEIYDKHLKDKDSVLENNTQALGLHADAFVKLNTRLDTPLKVEVTGKIDAYGNVKIEAKPVAADAFNGKNFTSLPPSVTPVKQERK